MKEVKTILENLNAALSVMTEKNISLGEEIGKSKAKQLKLDELQKEVECKVVDLNERELRIKGIESVVEFSEKAKKLMDNARDAMKSAIERNEQVEEKFKKLELAVAANNKKLEDGIASNKKQADALKKERASFEDRVKALKTLKVAL